MNSITKAKLGTFPITQQVIGIGQVLLNTIGLIKDISKVIFKSHYQAKINTEISNLSSSNTGENEGAQNMNEGAQNMYALNFQKDNIRRQNSPQFKLHLKGIFMGAVTATPVLGTIYNGYQWKRLDTINKMNEEIRQHNDRGRQRNKHN